MIYTRLYNLTDTRRFFPYLPPSGAWLDPQEAFVWQGDLRGAIAFAANGTQSVTSRLASLEADVAAGRVVLLDTTWAMSFHKNLAFNRMGAKTQAVAGMATPVATLRTSDFLPDRAIPNTRNTRFEKTLAHGLTNPKLLYLRGHHIAENRYNDGLLISQDYRQAVRPVVNFPSPPQWHHEQAPLTAVANPAAALPSQVCVSYLQLEGERQAIDGVHFYTLQAGRVESAVLHTVLGPGIFLESAWIDGANIRFAFRTLPAAVGNAPAANINAGYPLEVYQLA